MRLIDADALELVFKGFADSSRCFTEKITVEQAYRMAQDRTHMAPTIDPYEEEVDEDECS